jgi:DNA polymerase I-like protein with 3'-5' exonuclease and polymerase domains
LTDESNYEKVKGLIFKQLYGGVSKEFIHIPFFKKLSKFVDTLWDEFNTKGFITSKLFKRVIYKKWFDSSINKLTLFNYYIQSFESELCAFIIKDINDYIKNNELQSELILYTYDSFLFDIDKSEISTHLQKLKDIITYNNILTVTTKFGDNYQDLNSIKI